MRLKSVCAVLILVSWSTTSIAGGAPGQIKNSTPLSITAPTLSHHASPSSAGSATGLSLLPQDQFFFTFDDVCPRLLNYPEAQTWIVCVRKDVLIDMRAEIEACDFERKERAKAENWLSSVLQKWYIPVIAFLAGTVTGFLLAR